MKKALYFVAMLALFQQTSHAYELFTHGLLAGQAFQNSRLASNGLSDLGLDPSAPSPLGSVYFDVSGSQIFERTTNAFELNPGGIGVADFLTIKGWLMRGAIREDDNIFNGGSLNPQDDPYNVGDIIRDNRPLHHFYDPVNDRPLSVLVPGGLVGIRKAPEWAVGAGNVFNSPNAPESFRRNHFTVFDAREAMYRALTGRDSQGNVLQPLSGGLLTKPDDIRNAYWATTFRALGDIVHVVHDMAQPQHTRNEPHAGDRFDGSPGVFGHKSLYEAYVDARARGQQFAIIGNSSSQADPLPLGQSYPIPRFSDYLSYFTTRQTNGDVLARRGMADYSNRGFFSAAKNLGSPNNEYSLPPNDPGLYQQSPLTVFVPQPNGQVKPAQITLFGIGVPDALDSGLSQSANVTTFSMWDQFLSSANKAPTYSLNKFNYDEMANLLIPRAVAYSAGLIDYFFRGKIDMVPDPDLPQFLIKNLGTESINGKFELYYDAEDGTRLPVKGADGLPLEFQTNGDLLAGKSLPVAAFDAPVDPAPKQPLSYVLVFRGSMGEEKAGSGTVGAIAAKVIASSSSSALYILGLDANNNKLTLKVDKSGLRQIRGFDANGAFVQTDFDPFAAGIPEGDVRAGTGNSGNVFKAYLMKQVVFQPTVFPGRPSFKTVAVSVADPLSQGNLRPFAYLLDPTTNQWTPKGTGVTWTARSPDASIGQFQFTPVVTAFMTASLSFVRTFQDANGATRTATGSIALPTFGSRAMFVTYADFFTGKLFVSGDGLKVSGLKGYDCAPPDCDHQTAAYVTLSIALGETPSISVSQTSEPYLDFTRVFESTGTSSTETIASPCPPRRDGAPLPPVTITSGSGHFLLSTDTTANERIFVGYINGALASYRQMSHGTGVLSDDSNASKFGRTVCEGPVGGSSIVWLTESIDERTVDVVESTRIATFSDGTINSHIVSVNQEPGSFVIYNRVTQYSFTGFCPCPPVVSTPTGTPVWAFTDLLTAFTDKAADAISLRKDFPLDHGVVRLRGQDVSGFVDFSSQTTGVKDYVADISPQGELFFATSDKSVIIHDNQSSGMPKVVIPANVVKLIAALWL